ncbi:MAG: (Fe-S)-binding protein [bacterium]|nr:(Fe-S)-binding protein [bacterium]
MNKLLDWSGYRDRGLGDAYADIPNHGEDFAKAISVCIRSGNCQKTDNRGVMCPSFKVSQAPNFSPGGRVLLFKKLLNQDDISFLRDEALAESLAQCVSCKGCKRDCENGLDMAAIKVEYLAQRHQAGLAPKRNQLFAEFPFLLYRFGALKPLIKWRNRSTWLKSLGEKFLGINAQMPLPEPAAERYQGPKDPVLAAQSSDPNWSVVLLVDSLTAMFAPEAARDAEKLLRAAGYQVTVLHPQSDPRNGLLDSGRSLFSQGFIERAKEQAQQLLGLLTPFVEAGHRIIGLEPSTHLMLRDEFLVLGLGEPAQALAAQTLLLEEFIAKELAAKRFQAQFKAYQGPSPVLVHGHCHQKAVGAMKAMRKVVKLIDELPYQYMAVSCCGMAGSYGMEAENAAQSKAMAQLELLPSLDAEPQGLVLSNGFSCNQQILGLRGRKAVHLATLLCDHLKTD